MAAELERDVLKGVSRSFYLSLRLLPAPMRRPAGIAYLLARTSDTIADSAAIPATERLALLGGFSSQVSGDAQSRPFPKELIYATPDPKEKLLLECHEASLSALKALDMGSIRLIREVVGIIVSGQKLDVERFGDTVPGKVTPLASDGELDDYTWRVAGCVGEFWTKLGFETLGRNFSSEDPVALVAAGIEYGKGLQLVNILRDLPKDMGEGRCYLPVADPDDKHALMSCFRKWHGIAYGRMEAGLEYSSQLGSKRLRVASALPAMIGKATLVLMQGADWERLSAGIRIPRSQVYSIALGAFLRC